MVIGPAAILGLSTHTQEQWDAAVREPISYMAIGPAFGTGTKDTGYTAVGLDVVARASAAAAAAGPADRGDRRHHHRQRGVGNRCRRGVRGGD